MGACGVKGDEDVKCQVGQANVRWAEVMQVEVNGGWFDVGRDNPMLQSGFYHGVWDVHQSQFGKCDWKHLPLGITCYSVSHIVHGFVLASWWCVCCIIALVMPGWWWCRAVLSTCKNAQVDFGAYHVMVNRIVGSGCIKHNHGRLLFCRHRCPIHLFWEMLPSLVGIELEPSTLQEETSIQAVCSAQPWIQQLLYLMHDESCKPDIDNCSEFLVNGMQGMCNLGCNEWGYGSYGQVRWHCLYGVHDIV